MQSRDFVYWLQGFFEVGSMAENNKPEVSGLNASQVSMIRNHLNMVFAHEIDPAMGDKPHQAKLNATHVGAKSKIAPTKLIARC